MRVGLGSICRKLLEEVGIQVGSRVIQIHKIKDDSEIPNNMSPNDLNEIVDKSPVRCLDKNIEKEMVKVIDECKSKGDSVGGIFEVIATGMPYGLGSYTQWNKN